QGGSNVGDGLAGGGDGAAHVGRNSIVGTLEFRGPANVMVRHAEPKRSDAESVKDPAEGIVTESIRIPLRQYHYGAAASRRKPARVGKVVFRVRTPHRRGEAQELGGAVVLRGGAIPAEIWFDFAALQIEIGGRAIGKEVVAGAHEALVQVAEEARGSGIVRCRSGAVHARPAARPFHPPLERTDHAIGIPRGKAGLPRVHPT